MRIPRPIMVEAALALLLARLSLSLPASWLLRGAERGDWEGDVRLSDDPRARQVAQALARAARRLPFHTTCLVRAMAGRTMLRRRGIPCTLHLGVARQNGALAAHAWLTAEGGMITGGEEAPAFLPLAKIPAGRI